MYDLDAAIRTRRSTRQFLPDRPVPRELVDEALDLAMRAPSNSNIQPWRVVFTTGPARDRLVKALGAEARRSEPQIPPLPTQFEHHRFEVGAAMFGALGIARHDAEARRAVVLRNWDFFGAPLAGVVCMHRELDHVDSMSVGMFLQTLVLALTARGLSTCAGVDRRLPRLCTSNSRYLPTCASCAASRSATRIPASRATRCRHREARSATT